jgi:hypothetical protein
MAKTTTAAVRVVRDETSDASLAVIGCFGFSCLNEWGNAMTAN